MLDINYIRENIDKVKDGVAKKNYNPSIIDKLLEVDAKRSTLLIQVETLRHSRNQIGQNPTPEDLQKAREIKDQLRELEPQLDEIEKEYKQLLNEVPNIPLDIAPVGKSEDQNKEIKIIGQKTEFDFEPKDHLEIGTSLGILDFESGAKVSGSGFYYLKNEGALLELALIQYGLQFLREKGFIPVITPDLAREKYYLGTGYLPKGPEAQIYKVEGEDLGLIATAEVTLAALHADEFLEEKDLPKLYGGYSHCFRMESGAYGKYSKGLYRVHQFSKVEMFAFTTPNQSTSTHEQFLAWEEEFWQSLGIPFRVLEMCTGDLGAQAARKFDLEAWMPGRGDWGEITSTSNTTDYQTRNLNIKYKLGDSNEYLHTLNGTLVAVSRAIIAILENFQQADGSVKIPEVLQKYTGFSEIKPKS